MSGGDFHPIKFSKTDSPPKGKINSEFIQSSSSQSVIFENNYDLNRTSSSDSFRTNRLKTIKSNVQNFPEEENAIQKEKLMINEEDLKKDQKIQLLEKKVEILNDQFESKIKNYNEQINIFEKKTEELIKILEKQELLLQKFENDKKQNTLNTLNTSNLSFYSLPPSNITLPTSNLKNDFTRPELMFENVVASTLKQDQHNEVINKQSYFAAAPNNCCFTNNSFNNTIVQTLIIIGIILGCIIIFYLIFLFIFKLSRPKFRYINKELSTF